MERNQWESAAEAILFALGEPVEETRLAQAMGCPREAAARACQSLAQGYEAEQAGVRLVRLEESWQLVSAPHHPGPAVPAQAGQALAGGLGDPGGGGVFSAGDPGGH